MRRGNLFVISGPSGAGKGTLINLLSDKVPDIWVSVSATTREPRDGEQEGVNYFFKTPDEFKSMVDNEELLEWASYSGNYYGTPLESVKERVDEGFQVILEIDVQGAFQVKEKFPDAVLIFIEPPSNEELEHRLRGRGTDNKDSISERLKTAEVELAHKMEYDTQIVNDDLQTALGELADYINDKAEEERCREVAHEYY